ncbi:MAG: ABC transporter substrate-binding protein [Candidatus Dormibacteraeota bacterium]|nr:ABC transporter substrate-binding protein [Candidatus Dormibacteraeota bacterium]
MSRLRTAALALCAVCVAGCGAAVSAGTASPSAAPATVRVGYLTNLTHAPALIGISKGFFQQHLPAGTTLQTTSFSAGPAENEALVGGSLDAAFVGPNPAINAFQKTSGGIRVVAGVASGGAGLVVNAALAGGNFPADLRGQTLASPQLGNTQDVALRSWLSQHGLTTTVNGGGDVSIDVTSGNAIDLQRFEAGQIAGGWEPEPYESSYVVAGHGTLVVDEASLWPGGRFPTTELVVTTTFLTQHPDIVKDLIRGLLQSLTWIQQNSATAADAASVALAAVTGSKPLAPAVQQLAWSHLSFTFDPLASALQTDANHALHDGLITSGSIKHIVDVSELNSVLASQGTAPVGAGGLGS